MSWWTDTRDFLESISIDPLVRAWDWIMPDIPKPAGPEPGVLLNVDGADAKIPVIYGERLVGGVRVFKGVSGASNGFLHIVLVLCEGEIDAIGDVYIDDVISTDARYAGLITLTKYIGTATQAADPDLVAAFTGWTAAHQLKGTAYLHAKLTWNRDAFRGFPTITAVVRGRKVYDPRTALTTWSHNPALCLRDYLINTVYGAGLNPAGVPDAEIIAAANICEQQVETFSGSGATMDRFAVNGVIDTGRPVLDNIKTLLAAMRGLLPFTAGEYRLRIEQDEAPVFTFAEDTILGGWNIQGAGKRARLNRVKVRFINPARNWQADEAIQESAAWYAADGNLRLEQDVAFDLETDPYRAAYHAEVILKKSREGINCAFLATLDALQVAVGDVVAVTHPGPGWISKTFRVQHLELLPDGNVAVQLREHDPTAYDRTVPAGLPAPPDTNLPDPFTVQPPTGLALASGAAHLYVAGDGTVVSRIHAAWTAAADAYLDGYEVQIKESVSGTWLPAAAPDAGDTEAYLSPVKDGIIYDVRIRAVNTLGVRSAWATATNHTVIGKTNPPADVTGFGVFQNGDVVVFTWSQVADVDLAGYEIRYGPKSTATWADGTPLTEVTRGTQITSAAVPPGGWTFLVKARDTSGNYSTTAATKGLTVTNALDVIYQARQSPGWPGTRTGFLAHWTGVLVPDSTLAASAHTNADLFETFVPYPLAQCVYEAPEIDIGFDDTVRVWGDVESALGPGVATGVADPKLEIDHRLEAGAYGGFTPWAVGQVTARYVKHRLVLDTSRGRARVTGFLPTVDVRERTERATDVAVAAGGGAIAFSRPFHRKPEVRVTAIGGSARIAGADAVTPTGFVARVFDTTGADVGGTVNWSAYGG